jgi:hypothetical protein
VEPLGEQVGGGQELPVMGDWSVSDPADTRTIRVLMCGHGPDHYFPLLQLIALLVAPIRQSRITNHQSRLLPALVEDCLDPLEGNQAATDHAFNLGHKALDLRFGVDNLYHHRQVER